MSAYGHLMEREYSSQSLSSREDPEMESDYESGIYMTSYAATLFIGGVVIVGVSLMALVVALTVMLQSCQSKSTGVIELWKTKDDHNYCKILDLHSELNGLDTSSFPSACKDVAIHYIKDGQYMRDLNDTMQMIEKYFSSIRPPDDGRLDVVLMDADDLFPLVSSYSKVLLSRFNQYSCNDCINKASNLKLMYLLKIYIKLQAGGWPLVLLSRKPENLCNITVEHLISTGFCGWSSLFMRSDAEMLMDDFEYLSTRRHLMQKEGLRIHSVISSRMDALTGPFSGKVIFKFPNPMFYSSEHYTAIRSSWL